MLVVRQGGGGLVERVELLSQPLHFQAQPCLVPLWGCASVAHSRGIGPLEPFLDKRNRAVRRAKRDAFRDLPRLKGPDQAAGFSFC